MIDFHMAEVSSIAENYGLTLRLLRKSHNMNLNILARKLNVSISYLSGVERGTKKANIELINKYSKIFNVKPYIIHYLAVEKDKESLKNNFISHIMKIMGSIEKWGLKD